MTCVDAPDPEEANPWRPPLEAEEPAGWRARLRAWLPLVDR
jgi:hypothetical protein